MRMARSAITEITGVRTTVSKPASSWLSPIITPPSLVCRTVTTGWSRKGATFSVTMICPLLGFTGASSPTIGASRAFPRPAARTIFSDRKAPQGPVIRKPPASGAIAWTGWFGR